MTADGQPFRTVRTKRALLVFAISMAMTAIASIAPAKAIAEPENRRLQTLVVASKAMGIDIPVRVYRADSSEPAPTLYLLNGAQGGANGSSWFDQTDIVDFFAQEHVNIVVPMGGEASYFTDWRRDDPVLGRQRWTTFLTDELPAAINDRLKTDGRNAIAGISMAGTSVFQLSLAAPDLYRGLGSFSGCAQTSDPVGQGFVRVTVARGGGNADNMWGAASDPRWKAADPLVHAEQFRGKSVYVSNGSGLPGRHDTIDGPGIEGNATKLGEQVVVGAVIETATDVCSRNLERRFAELGIAGTFHFYSGGTHSWGYWQDELHRAWPQFRAALSR